MGAIYKAFHYGDGDIPDRAFKTSAPPEGNCTIRLPGDPVVEDIPAEGVAELGGKRFSVNCWFEGVKVSFGWIDFNAAKFEGGNFDQIAVPFRKREEKRLGGESKGESLLDYVVGKRSLQVKRTKMDLPEGKAILQVYIEPDAGRLKRHIVEKIERVNVFDREPTALALSGMWLPLDIDVKTPYNALDPNQKIRLYFALAQGKKITVDTPWVQKFFNSFVPE
jgi:hypothetical protein